MNETTSRTRAAACVAVLTLAIAGCAGGDGLSCQDDERYRTSDSIPPVRVPDDLSPPNQSEALQVPPGPARGSAEAEQGPCLEAPPDYFDE